MTPCSTDLILKLSFYAILDSYIAICSRATLPINNSLVKKTTTTTTFIVISENVRNTA